MCSSLLGAQCFEAAFWCQPKSKHINSAGHLFKILTTKITVKLVHNFQETPPKSHPSTRFCRLLMRQDGALFYSTVSNSDIDNLVLLPGKVNRAIAGEVIDLAYPFELQYDVVFSMETNMLTKVLRIEDNTIVIPGLEKYRGKMVEITVREKKENKKQDLTAFFALCGKISIDSAEVEKLREDNMGSRF